MRLHAAALADPEVDRFNLRIGTQTFAPKYHFTTNTTLVETAAAIREMGSDVVKFHLGRGFAGQYGIAVPAGITNLATMARDEPSCRRVLDMTFRHYLIWAYCLSATADAWWLDGFGASERQKEYAEIHSLCRHLLTTYNDSGKSFYLGHWEGDWYLLPNYNTAVNPTPTAIRGMIDWLTTRQQAVDDALRETPHTNVSVYAYAEVNRVRDAMVNGPGANQRLVNTVLPAVTNLDFVSWSSYDGMDLDAAALRSTLDYLEAHLSPVKSAVIPGRRVLIGEYGWGGTLSPAAQEPPTRAYLRRLLPWSPRFILFWEMYDNEGKNFALIDRAGNRTPCYALHQGFLAEARLRVARFRESHARLPDDVEFATLVTPLLEHPLTPSIPLAVTNAGAHRTDATTVVVQGTVAQGVYGDEAAVVAVFWGARDGGTDPAAWDHRLVLGVNQRFNSTTFTGVVTEVPADGPFFYRFHATNPQHEAWAPSSDSAMTEERPRLELLPAEPGSVRLAWPASATGFELFLATNLASPTRWQRVTASATLVDRRWEWATTPPSPGSSFYQLGRE